MKRLGKITSIPLGRHLSLLVLLNETIGGSTGSSDKEKLLPRIYRKWKDALPDLEDAPLFKVLGRRKEYDEGIGRTYPFAEAEKDSWANLFEYQGSEENVRLKFAIDKIGVSLDETSIIFGDSQNADAWDQFISSLKRDGKEESESVEETVVAESPMAPSFSPQGRKIFWLSGHRWVMLVVVGIIATLVIWKLYRPSAPQPEVVPKEKIIVSQPERAQTAVTPPVEAVSKEKGKPALPEKISKTVTSPPPKEEVASREKMAFPLPDLPSIAVLPFVNMSEDPRQEFLCDAITETITTALSKVRHLFVISRQSTFSYKGKPVEVKQVSEELGVRYVLEGSVQKSGDRIRINAQLIDALTGRHIWAELYERDLKDIFALQDEITMRILTAIQVKLTEGEQASMPGKTYEKYFKGKQGLDCYLKIMEGFKYAEGHNIEDVRVARRLAEEAIAVCPDVPFAYGLLGYVHHLEYYLGSGKSPQDSIEKGIEMAQKAIALNDSDAMAHGLLGTFYIMKREYDKAIAEGERSVALAPGAASLYIWYAMSLNFAGRPEEAIPLFQNAIRLDPFGRTGVYLNLGIALGMTSKFEEAVSALRKAIQRAPDNIIAHYNLTATYSMMGREKEARAEAAEVLRINPKFSLDLWTKRGRQIYKDESEVDKLVDAMRKAGLK
jgi:TolB-like protein/Flp pilus assembly protein TadD